ncbi:BTAD domain-containing putative transcriptional regulator [Deinococcus altitudinis]|uniref:BTAD domain-containing putative transcriptional regulator n=1 Tax=Deinococcus altitudinis TaxID=468914 RepID=UPI003891C5F3
MSPESPVVILNLLGIPSLEMVDQTRLLERKAGGVLAYVCLAGQVERERLASLLWPDVPDRSARTNLRQALWRLRSYGADLVVGDRSLALGEHVHADVTAFLSAASRGDDLDRPAWEGELLAGKEFSDCPAFEEWLLSERERHRTLRYEALWRRCRADQEVGDLVGAIRRATRLLELDPLSESVYRQIMTLHLGRGDRGAALAAFRTCREVLRRELGVSPLPETLALADRIRRAGAASEQSPAVWRPPLIGRETEWLRLNTALNARKMVMVSGPPGMGKTRLLQEVLNARGTVLCLESRPNDEAVPHLALGQLARRLLKLHRDATLLDPSSTPAPLEEWVRAEAAHLLPDLWPGGHGPGLLNSETAQRRFMEGMTRLVTSLLPLALNAQAQNAGAQGTEGQRDERDASSLLFDDVQWMDDHSWDAWMFIFAQPEWRSLDVRVGFTFRQGELSFTRLDTTERLVIGGAALSVDLQPLHEAEVETLKQAILEHQGATTGDAASVAGGLWRHTGGNPLFVLETLRSLIDAGGLGTGGLGARGPIGLGSRPELLPPPLPLPPELEPLLRRRLERVSEPALRLARVAAVAGSEFDAELAAHVIGVHPLDLVQPWAELESAQIMNGPTFTHDLIAQAARQSVPQPVRALLHGNIAAHLQGRAGPYPRAAAPEHLALHWEAAGQPINAAPHWVRAGWAALSRGAWTDAAGDFRRAMTSSGSDRHSLHSLPDAQYGLGMALSGRDPDGAEQALLAALSSALDVRREAEVSAALAELYRLCGRLDEAQTRIARATELAVGHLSPPEQAELWRVRFAVQLRAGQYAAAEEAILAAQALAPGRTEIVNEHALLLWVAGRLEEAAQLYESFRPRLQRSLAAGSSVQENLPTDPSWYSGNLGWTYWALGRLSEAEAVLSRPLSPPGSPFDTAIRQVHQATVSISQGRYRQALAELGAAEPVLTAYPPHLVDVWHRRGLLAGYAGRHEEAADLLIRAVNIAQGIGDPVRLSLALSTLTTAYASLGQREEAERWGQRIRDLSVNVQVPLTQLVAHHALALVASLGGRKDQAAQLADEAVQQAGACRMDELLARSLLIRAMFREPAGCRADLLEVARLAQAGGMLDVHHQAARELSEMDPAWRPQAEELYRQLLALAPPDFLRPTPSFIKG